MRLLAPTFAAIILAAPIAVAEPVERKSYDNLPNYHDGNRVELLHIGFGSGNARVETFGDIKRLGEEHWSDVEFLPDARNSASRDLGFLSPKTEDLIERLANQFAALDRSETPLASGSNTVVAP